jgi:hypothetical protein
MGLLSSITNSIKARRLAAELVDGLKRVPRPGGLELPKFNQERPNDPANQRALLVQEALIIIGQKHPELGVTKFRDTLVLKYRADFEKARGAAGQEEIKRAGLHAGGADIRGLFP